AADLRISCNSK
nr:Chain P, MAP kinase 14 [synthetic construct]